MGSRPRGGVAEWLRQGPAKPCTRVRFPPPPRAISSVGERFLDTEEVTSSILVSPTTRTAWSGASNEVQDRAVRYFWGQGVGRVGDQAWRGRSLPRSGRGSGAC